MQFLGDIDPDEVSPVRRGAQGRRFAFAKSALEPALLDVLEVPFEREGALVDELRKADTETDAQMAAVAVVRLLKGFDLDAAAIAKAMSQGDDPDDDVEPDKDDVDDIHKAYVEQIDKDFTAEQRRQMAESGEAMDDGSYPIPNRDYLKRAVHAIGRGKNNSHQAIREHIASRARALGATDLLPDDWKVSKAAGELGATETKEQQMSETAAPAVPVLKADGSWDLSGVPDDARGFYESVLKAADNAKAESEALRERVEKAETSAADANAKLREREFVAKAENEYGKLAPAEDLGQVLKAAQESMDAEAFEKLEGILKGASERVQQGDLFAELGARVQKGDSVLTAAHVRDASTGDAWAKIEKLAEGLVEKSGDSLSQEQAISKVLKTAEGASLYSEYMGEYYGGVA